jgi:hypothetical protein
MALNERIQWDVNDLSYGQLAPSQEHRTNFTPGKVAARPGDMNWPTDFRVPVGLRAFELSVKGPLEVERVRIIKLHRGSVSDQTISAPVVTGMKTVVISSPKEWGIGAVPQHVMTDTVTAPRPAVLERTAGYDWAKGA